MELYSILEAEVRNEGFTMTGGLDFARAAEAFGPHLARYDAWLADGRAGAMEYLKRGRDRRADPTLLLPGAKSVFCVAVPYDRRPGGAPDPSQGPRVARYIGGRDYHDELAERLERAVTKVQARHPGFSYKVCIDSSAVLERSWAALAGLGWIGKNTLLMSREGGSYFFLAEVLLTEELGRGPVTERSFCGHCRACLDACPTQALTETQGLDSNRCISYWSLEYRGPLGEERPLHGWVAGCDLCQEACPFNRKPVAAELAAHSERAPREWWSWETLLEETEAAYRERVRDSALNRVKPVQFRRNLARSLRSVLDGGTATESAELRERLLEKVRQAVARETDPLVRAEWERCADALGIPR